MLNKIKKYCDNLLNKQHPDGSEVVNIASIVKNIGFGFSYNEAYLKEGDSMFPDTLYDFSYGTKVRGNVYIIVYSDTIIESPYCDPNTFEVSNQWCHTFWTYQFRIFSGIGGQWVYSEFLLPVTHFTSVASGRQLNYPNGHNKTIEELAEDYQRAMGVI